MAKFTGKLFCNKCTKAFKRKSQNGKFCWVCQGYDNYQSCDRLTVDEEWLTSLIAMRLFWDERKHLDRFIAEQLHQIVFESKTRMIIKFKSPKIDDMILHDGNNYYGSNIRVSELGW